LLRNIQSKGEPGQLKRSNKNSKSKTATAASSSAKSRVVSYIHVGDAGKDDFQDYMKGSSRLQLQVFSVENLADLDASDMINGLDQVGTSADFCDEAHRCSRACPVGCQGHLRPNEVIIYEGVDVNGRLQDRKKYKGRFIQREVPKSKPSCNSNHERLAKKGDKPPAEMPAETLDSEIGEEMPQKYLDIIKGSAPDATIVKDHGWNPADRSYNLTMKSSEHLTVRRQPVTQSTDGVRGKRGYSRGIMIYEICWPVRMRGTHATVGVALQDAPIHSMGYHALIGSTERSWGWDIGRKECFHQGVAFNYPPAVRKHYQWTVPETIFLIIDMDERTVSFGVNGKWLGVAFSGIQTESIFPAISTVWGHAEISIRLVGSNRPLTATTPV